MLNIVTKTLIPRFDLEYNMQVKSMKPKISFYI